MGPETSAFSSALPLETRGAGSSSECEAPVYLSHVGTPKASLGWDTTPSAPGKNSGACNVECVYNSDRRGPLHHVVGSSGGWLTRGYEPFLRASPCIAAFIRKAANCPKCRRVRLGCPLVSDGEASTRQRQGERTARTPTEANGDRVLSGISQEQRADHRRLRESHMLSLSRRDDWGSVRGESSQSCLHDPGTAGFPSSLRGGGGALSSSCSSFPLPQSFSEVSAGSYFSSFSFPISSSHSSSSPPSPWGAATPALSSPSSQETLETARSGSWSLLSRSRLSSPATSSCSFSPSSLFFSSCASPSSSSLAASSRYATANSCQPSPLCSPTTGPPPLLVCSRHSSASASSPSSAPRLSFPPLYGCLCSQSRRVHPRGQAFFYASPWREDHRVFRISTVGFHPPPPSSSPASSVSSLLSAPASPASIGLRSCIPKSLLSSVSSCLFRRSRRGTKTKKVPEPTDSPEESARLSGVSTSRDSATRHPRPSSCLDSSLTNQGQGRRFPSLTAVCPFKERHASKRRGVNRKERTSVLSFFLLLLLLTAAFGVFGTCPFSIGLGDLLFFAKELFCQGCPLPNIQELLLFLQRVFCSPLSSLRTLFLSTFRELLVLQHAGFFGSRITPTSAIAGLVLLSCACVIYCLLLSGPYIVEESLEIVANFGVQLQRKTRWGHVHREFIRASKVRAVLLNEGIRICDVVFYVAILAEDQPNLIVPFEHFAPRLEVNLIIYETLHHLLGVSERRSVHTS